MIADLTLTVALIAACVLIVAGVAGFSTHAALICAGVLLGAGVLRAGRAS